MSQPLVTVGIPTYQRHDSLRKSLADLFAQDYPNLEVLVADNTPGNERPPWLLHLIKEEPRLRYVRHPTNIGLMPNHHYLLDHAAGDLFCWWHDDDSCPSNYISRAVTELVADPELSLVGPRCRRFFEGCYWYEYERYSSTETTQAERLKDLIVRAFVSPHNFEHLMYGVFRRRRLHPSFRLGRWRSVILFFFLLSTEGTIKTLPDVHMVKNTTQADMNKYASASYVTRIPFFKTIFKLEQEVRVTVALELLKFIVICEAIPFRLRLDLQKTVMLELARGRPYLGFEPPTPVAAPNSAA